METSIVSDVFDPESAALLQTRGKSYRRTSLHLELSTLHHSPSDDLTYQAEGYAAAQSLRSRQPRADKSCLLRAQEHDQPYAPATRSRKDAPATCNDSTRLPGFRAQDSLAQSQDEFNMVRTKTHSGSGLFGRRRNVKTTESHNPITGTHKTTTTTTTHGHSHATGHHATTTGTGVHHKRRPSFGDKISGAMMKLRGSLTRRPGLKAAGTRRMHGTDGRGSHRVAAY